MTTQNSQIPRICGSCGKIHSPSELCYTPLKCWNCGKKHSTTREFCYTCKCWTPPTMKRATPEAPKEPIHWHEFIIAKTDSSQVKSDQLKSAVDAIEKDQYTAVLCAESPDSPYAKDNTEKIAVFLYRPGGDKKLSVTKLEGISASSRKWEEIKLSDWTMFEEILGVDSLPSSFPTPDNICLLEDDELDTGLAGFSGVGLSTG
ncbi:uncharacterized protein EAF02_002925 [Botrytis sinoallii]|uniref:uncharacterized protein n=1 Tax=Botrytis sinoallii TaxID=1463999 RepID=UPI001900496B|nr:uncharacterized protein EAF02_002925 [Botrytis sinoallii]KAF7888384.1 hypothetical protein EAF02_002925 [Botrytis sinoallii]